MAAFEVRIENLESMMIAMAQAVSESPERDAWKKMEAWAGPIGLLDDPEKHRLYAVTSCNLLEEVNSEFFKREGHLESWKKLNDWIEQSRYEHGNHQALERHLDPRAALSDLVLDLYLPVAE